MRQRRFLDHRHAGAPQDRCREANRVLSNATSVEDDRRRFATSLKERSKVLFRQWFGWVESRLKTKKKTKDKGQSSVFCASGNETDSR